MIVVDIESTGTSMLHSSIVELAALDMDNPTDVFSEYCRPFDGAEIEDGALQVMGVTKESLFTPERQRVESLMEHFMAWLEPKEDRTFAGAYVGFDIFMVKTQFERMGKTFSIGYGAMEMNSLVYAWLKKNGKEVPMKNDAIYAGISSVLKNNYVGLAIERKGHTAKEDVELGAEILSRILYGKQLLPQYLAYPLPEQFISLV